MEWEWDYFGRSIYTEWSWYTNLVYSYTDPSTSCTNTDVLVAIVLAPPVDRCGIMMSRCVRDSASVTMVANQSGGTMER